MPSTPTLKDAEDARLLSRIERNFECLRRDGRAEGTLSGWGDVLRTKYKTVRAEKSDLAPAQSVVMAAWLEGSLTGRVAMVEFLQAEKVVRQLVDPCSLCGCFGLNAIMNAEWLYAHCFSRPPQAVIYETLLLCAEDALERKPENLTAQQINLALRKLALNHLPKSGDAARLAEQAKAQQVGANAGGPAVGEGGASSSRVPGSPGAFGGAACAAAGDMYLRIQVAMELLWLHVSPHKAKATALQHAESLQHDKQPGSEDSAANSSPSPNLSLEQLAEAALAAVEGSPVGGVGSGEDLVWTELGFTVGEDKSPTGGGGESAGRLKYSPAGVEALNKFLEAYVGAVSDVQAKLVHQVRWLEERGAYHLLGVDESMSEAAIKKKFHRLSLKAHPDKGGDSANFLRLKNAYESVLKKRRRAADKIAKKESREAAAKASAAARRQGRGGGGGARSGRGSKSAWASPTPPSEYRKNPYRSRSPSPEDDLRGDMSHGSDFVSPSDRPRRPPGMNGANSPDWELNLSDDDDDEGAVPSPESSNHHREGTSLVEDDDAVIDDDDVTPGKENIRQSSSRNDGDYLDESAKQTRDQARKEARDDHYEDRGANGTAADSPTVVDEAGEEAFGDDSGDFLADDVPVALPRHGTAADSDEDDEGRVELDLSDGEDGDDDGVWPQASSHDHHRSGAAQDKEDPDWFKSGGAEEGHYDEEEEEEGAPTLSLAENRAQLAELEDVAKTSAKKAASLAHITIQWSKVVEEVRLLARPRGVEHLASLIKKGAFSSAVDVMEPTQAAATACMAVVGCAIEVTKVSDRSMALANNLGFFKAADKVTVEGRAALETAATAASVNEAAVRAMGRLNSLGDLARDDDEVHLALVDMLCLHFARVAEATQQCAKQALVAVTAASHVCALLDVLHDQTQLEADGLAQSDDEDDDDEDRHPDDQAEYEAKQKEAREAARAEAEAKAKKEENGEEEGEDNDDMEKENKEQSNGAETVDSLMGKLKDLHAEMRVRHTQNLKKANNEVLALQRRAEKAILDLQPAGQQKEGGASSSPEWRHLFCTLADLVNASVVALENDCRDRLRALHAPPLSPGAGRSSHATGRAAAALGESGWFRETLEQRTAWWLTLARRDEIALATTARAKVLRLAALVDKEAVVKMLDEMEKRLQGLLESAGERPDGLLYEDLRERFKVLFALLK